MLETILIQGVYPYTIPPPPEDETLIINHEIEDKAEQYWRTPTFPNLAKMSAYEKEQFIRLEDDRMENGVYFYNNGELVYITGAHYEYLAYWKPDYDLKFRHVDRLYFYFDEFVDNYKSCLGKVIFKPRVGGFTAKENFLCFRKSVRGFGRHVALINTTLDNAINLQYKPIRDCILNYPTQFRPRFKMVNGRIPETGIEYKSVMEHDNRRYLKGWLIPFPPKANSLDGKRTHYIFCDEISKMESVDPEDITKPFLKTYFDPAENKLHGRMTFVSTLGTDDILMRKAIDFYLKMLRDSNFEELDENGFTQSKFLRYFISCYEVKFIDKYGFSDIEKGIQEQEEVLRKIIAKEGEYSKAHISELRENPRTMDDLLNVQKTGSTFNINGIVSKQREQIENLPVELRGYFTGKFVMSDNGDVIIDRGEQYVNYGWQFFIDKGYGKNLHKKSSGYYYCCRKPDGVVGYDPYRIGKPISKNFSNAGIVVFQSNDLHSKNGIEDEVIASFNGRSTDPEEIHEQSVLASIYYGFILAPETNIGTDWFSRNGYLGLLPNSWYQKGSKGIMITTGKGERNVLEHGVKAILKWVIGKDKKSNNHIKTLKCLRLLMQLEKFVASENDALNKADMVAAFLQAKLVSDKLIQKQEKNKTHDKSTIKEYYHVF